jgi:hypothetical protein
MLITVEFVLESFVEAMLRTGGLQGSPGQSVLLTCAVRAKSRPRMPAEGCKCVPREPKFCKRKCNFSGNIALVFRPLLAALPGPAPMGTPHPALELFRSGIVRNVSSEIRSCHPPRVWHRDKSRNGPRRSLRAHQPRSWLTDGDKALFLPFSTSSYQSSRPWLCRRRQPHT